MQQTEIKNGKYNVKERVRLNKLLLCCLLIVLVIIGTIMVTYSSFVIIPDAKQQKNDAILTLNGELSPFSINPEKPFYLFIGTEVPFHFTEEQLASGINLNDFITSSFLPNITSDDFQLNLMNGNLQVSASIRDSNGDLITQIVNNTWKTVDPNYQLIYWDRNYNSYAFEVVTSNYVPIIQVAMIGPNEIQFDGLLYTKDGFVRIAPMSNGGASIEYYPENMTFDEVNQNLNIPLLFKYPALTNASNLGKMVNPIYPSSDPLTEANSSLQQGLALQISGSLIVAFFGVAFPSVLVVQNVSKQNKQRRGIKLPEIEKFPVALRLHDIKSKEYKFRLNINGQPVIDIQWFITNILGKVARTIGASEGQRLHGFMAWIRNGGVKVSPHDITPPKDIMNRENNRITEATVEITIVVSPKGVFTTEVVKELLQRGDGVATRNGWYEILST